MSSISPSQRCHVVPSHGERVRPDTYSASYSIAPVSSRQDFQTPRVETVGGILLFSATVAALIWANSPWAASYTELWSFRLRLGWGSLAIEESLHGWVNDGLMTIFFFVVGIEIKQEMVLGQLAHLRDAILPVVAAIGGVIVPAGIYFAINAGGGGAHGWGVPMATDIAFAMGVVALAGRLVPPALKVTLLALAVVDDIVAIVVIALFYGSGTDLRWLALAVGAIVVVLVMQHLGVEAIVWYVPVGALAWYAMFRSGVHATIAGVVLGLITPVISRGSSGDQLRRLGDDSTSGPTQRLSSGDGIVVEQFEVIDERSVAQRIENRLTPFSSYLVIPLFALANAGIVLSTSSLRSALSSRVSLGVFLGLFVGKVLGITGAVGALIRSGRAELPEGVTMRHIVAMGLTAGIGFTVSLFISDLAFDDGEVVNQAKMAILAASIISAASGLGALWLVDRLAGKQPS